MAETLRAKLLAYVDRDGPGSCWIWRGPTQRTYGILHAGGRTHLAHRASYEVFVGPIPKGLQIDHLCRVRLCVNPGHLEAVTQAENILRGIGAPAMNGRKTSCLNGHPLSGNNLRINPKGWRLCRTCELDRTRRYRAEKAEQRRQA